MVIHARGEGVPCSYYSASHVGHDQSRLMENLPNHLSHHGHLLLCCPSSLPFFSWIFLSVQIGNYTKQMVQCKVHKIFFPTSLHLSKTHSNWGSYAPFSPSLQSAPCWFQHVHLRCLRHSSSRGSSIVSIMDALNRGLDGDPEYSTFLHCKSLDLCTKLMRLSDVRSWNLKMLMMVFKILGTVSLLIIWVSCPAWLVKFGASPDMCSFRVMSLTKRKARSRFAIICKHMQHNHILN